MLTVTRSCGHSAPNTPRQSRRTLGSGLTQSPSAAEDLDEGPSELNVEGGVDNWVEGAVNVPQPRESTVKPRRHVACPAVGVQYVSHKERQPADEKHPWSNQRVERNGEGTGEKTQ